MRVTDLEHFFLTPADVEAVLPALPRKTLQNWGDNGYLDLHAAPGRHQKRKYSAAGVIVLAAMHDFVCYGITPANARDMTDGIAARAVELWAQSPDEAGEHGERTIVIKPGEADYKIGLITRGADGAYALEMWKQHPSIAYAATTLPDFYSILQVDFLIIKILNRIHRRIAVLPPVIAAASAPARKRKTAKSRSKRK